MINFLLDENSSSFVIVFFFLLGMRRLSKNHGIYLTDVWENMCVRVKTKAVLHFLYKLIEFKQKLIASWIYKLMNSDSRTKKSISILGNTRFNQRRFKVNAKDVFRIYRSKMSAPSKTVKCQRFKDIEKKSAPTSTAWTFKCKNNRKKPTIFSQKFTEHAEKIK